MSTPLLWLVTVIYVSVAFSYYREKNPGMCLTFIGYAFANVGLIIAK